MRTVVLTSAPTRDQSVSRQLRDAQVAGSGGVGDRGPAPRHVADTCDDMSLSRIAAYGDGWVPSAPMLWPWLTVAQ